MLFFFFLLFPAMAPAQFAFHDDRQENKMKGPWHRPEAAGPFHGPASKPTHGPAQLVEWYREYISPIDGSDCPMVPSCSQYSMECFEKHGFVMGWMMTCDRLFRCGRDELKLSPRIVMNGQEKCYDPVANNDFWWGHRGNDE